MILLLLIALQDLAEIKQLLGSDEAASRRKGLEALAQLKGSDKDEAHKFALELLEKHKAEFDELKGAIDPKKIKKPLDEWAKQQDKALGAVMNTGSFPDPRPGDKIKGPYKGFDKVDAAMKKLEAAFGEVSPIVDALQPKKLMDAAARVRQFEEALGKSNTADVEAFWPAAAKFESGELSAATDVPPLQKQLLFVLYCRAFMKAELAADNGMSDKEKEGVRLINRLRMMLGVPLLEGDSRLAKSIELHIEDMEKNGYFGHTEKNEGSKTPQQRCQNQGYKGTTGEDLASSPEPDKSIEMWRWDGGHFRNMINPAYVQIGLGIGKSSCGFCVGSGDGAKLPRFEK